MPHSAALALCGLLLAAIACTPGSGAVRLEARSGRVADRDSGQAVAGADVFQVYWGRGVAGEPRPAWVIRRSVSDAAGGFAFEDGVSGEPRSWVLETDDAEYAFFHPDYGLVRSGSVQEVGPLLLEGVRFDTARRRSEMLSLCGSRPPDALVEEVARSHCSHTQR